MALGRHLGRRQFLKIAGVAAGAAAAGAGARFFQGPEPPAPAESRKVATFCELCFWKCGVLATVENGKVTRLEGHPEHPLARGRLCPRGNGGAGLLYDPDRLKTPLIREGRRGQERFREASWDEALDYVAGRMREIKQKYGPEAMVLFTHGHGGSFFAHLIKAYGSPNIAAPSYAQCRGPREAGFQVTFGTGVGSPENTDIANTRLLVLIGSHLGENMHNTQVQEFAEALRRGARIVVVDPRFSTAASKAHWYLPIKPGTDLALLLAWIHVLIEEELYDREYVEQFGFGFDKLKEITASDTPEWAAAITEIPADTIRAVAREMGREKPAVLVHPGRHATWYGDDTQRSRAIAILNGLLGSWGRPGGFYLPGGVTVPKLATPEYPKPARPPADGSGSPAFARRRSPARRIPPRAGSSTGRICFRACPTRLKPSRPSTGSSCSWWWTCCRRRSPAMPTWCCPNAPISSATTISTPPVFASRFWRCGSRPSNRCTTPGPAGGWRASWRGGWTSKLISRGRTSRSIWIGGCDR